MIEVKSGRVSLGRDSEVKSSEKLNGMFLSEVKPKEMLKNAAWDEYVLKNPAATLFHLSGWQRILEKTFSYRCFSLAATKGEAISGILPLFLVKNFPFGHSLVSTPLAVYGGICADDTETESLLLNHARTLAGRLGVRYIEFRNQRPLGEMPTKDLYFTFQKEIFDHPEKNMAAIPRKRRWTIRQSEKHGLQSVVGREELIDGFYDVYSRNVRNLGTPVFPLSLFRNLLREFDQDCRILGIFHQGKMVATAMTFFFKDRVMPYYVGGLKEAAQYLVNDFMYWSLLCYSSEQGYKLFDFGRSKKGTGAYQFKQHWGFEPIALPYQYHLVREKEMPNLSPNNPKFSLAIELWKKMPLPMTQWLGPKVVRYFP